MIIRVLESFMNLPNAPIRRNMHIWVLPALWTLALGFWGLSRQGSVWRDEAATWQVAQRSTSDIVHMLGHVDVVHGLYYLFMHALFEVFGPSTTVLRLPSVLATAVAAACITITGHRLAGVSAGLTAGLALGLLPAVQFYLQEGRPYALVAAGASASTLLLVTALQGRGRYLCWIGYGGIVATCGLLNWLSLMLLLAHLVTLIWVRAGRRVWTSWAVASALATAVVLPLVLFSRNQSDQVSWIPPLTWHMMIGPAVLLAIGSLGVLADRSKGGRLSPASVGLPLLAVPQLGLIGLSLIQPLFLDRYILFSLLGLSLLLGAMVDAVVSASTPRFPKASIFILPAVIAIAVLALLPQSLAKRSPASRVDDVMAAAAEVRRLAKPGDAVIYIPAARRDTRLVSPGAFVGVEDVALAESPEASGTLKGVEVTPARIRSVMRFQERIILVSDASGAGKTVMNERDRAKMSILATYFTPVADEQVRGRRVTVYEHRASVE